MRMGALAVTAWVVLALPVVWSAPTATTAQSATPQSAAPLNPNVAPVEAGTGAISGVVTDAVTKAPLQGAVVYLGPASHGPPDAPLRQMTDARGRFVFRRLPAFNGYVISVSKFGYFDGVYGRGATGTTLPGRIVLREGEWFSQADIALMKPFWRLGARRVASTRPGDDGRYVVPGLPPGEYYIAAVTDHAPEDLADPVWLAALVPASVKLTLAEGERKTQDLRIAR